MTNPDREALYYRLVGYYYNYPTCCIEAYVRERLLGRSITLRRRAEIAMERGFIEGFIPCLVCSRKVEHRLKHRPEPTDQQRLVNLWNIDFLKQVAKDLTDFCYPGSQFQPGRVYVESVGQRVIH
jgi:hypothetical protein